MNHNFQLAPIFSDHMVLQRDKPIKVWGTANEDCPISVEFCGRRETTRAGEGKWSVVLDPLPAGGPYEMKVMGGDAEIRLTDVLVGEVWLAGGQSNMEMIIQNTIHGNEAKSLANDCTIRYYDAPRIAYETESHEERVWQVTTPENVEYFSSVAFYFAVNISKQLKVPVGIINCDWGGTSASCWMSEAYLLADDATRIYYDEYQNIIAGQDPEFYETEYEAYQQQVREYAAKKDGIGIDPRNTEDYLAAVNAIIYPWPPPMGPKCFLRPCGLYHSMIQRIVPYSLRGVIWYQGETDAGRPLIYGKLFGNLIRNWREDWQDPDMPFLFIQLPGYALDNPEGEEWALLREQQFLVSKSVHNTGMVVSYDCGDKDNLHPTLKKPIGERLALLARAKIYGQELEFSGPVFSHHEVQGNRIVLYFDHVGQGLTARGGLLQGFQICGADGIFINARAEIKDNCVEVYHESLTGPREARYLWANYVEGNLYNQGGLPAMPFRTGGSFK